MATPNRPQESLQDFASTKYSSGTIYEMGSSHRVGYTLSGTPLDLLGSMNTGPCGSSILGCSYTSSTNETS
jgi:hypothetical protein